MDTAILIEIQRLNIQIAILQYDCKEAIKKGTPVANLDPDFRKLAILQIQRQHLREGRFKELPYPIQWLYKKESNTEKIVNNAIHLDEFTQ